MLSDANTTSYAAALADVNDTIGIVYSLFDPTTWGRVQPTKDLRDQIAAGWSLAQQQGNDALAASAVDAMQQLARVARADLLDANGDPKVTKASDYLGLANQMSTDANQFLKDVAAPFSTALYIIAGGVAVGIIVGAYFYTRKK